MTESMKLEQAIQLLINVYTLTKKDVDNLLTGLESLKNAVGKMVYQNTGKTLEEIAFAVKPKLPRLKNAIEIIDSDRRLIRGVITSSIHDKHGQKLNIGKLSQKMDRFIQRGGIIVLEHSSDHVGRTISWQEVGLEFDNGEVHDGIAITAEIFSDTGKDDDAWYWIKSGAVKGFSILEHDNQIIEVSLCVERNPANPYCVLLGRSEAK